MCPRYVQDVGVEVEKGWLLCLQRCGVAISAVELLDGIEDISLKQRKRKYLQPLLDLGLIEMTMPNVPTSRKQNMYSRPMEKVYYLKSKQNRSATEKASKS